MNHGRLVGAALILLALCGCAPNRADVPDPEATGAKGTYIHEPSGMVFPERIHGFKRLPVHEFDEVGRNISVGYNLRGLVTGIAVTVYVYPGPLDVSVFRGLRISGPTDDSTRHHFKSVKREIVARNKGAELVDEDRPTVTQGDIAKTGYHAVFRFDHPSAWGKPKLRSEAFLFVHGRWFIKYRITYLEAFRERHAPKVEEFLRDLRWPGNP